MFLIPKTDFKIKITEDRGKGAFALRKIEAGTIIGDYLGKLIKPSEEDAYEKKYGLYAFFYNFKATIFPDLKSTGVHLINHSCMSNCGFFPYQGHILYFALRTIFPGEELTVQYLLDAVTEDDKDYYLCHCHTPLCHGTMCNSNKSKDKQVMSFILARQGKYLKKLEVPYGQSLSPLKKYPLKIADYRIYDLYGYLSKAPFLYKDKVLPKVTELRNRIRRSGRTLRFERMNLDVWGVADDLIIAKPIKN